MTAPAPTTDPLTGPQNPPAQPPAPQPGPSSPPPSNPPTPPQPTGPAPGHNEDKARLTALQEQLTTAAKERDDLKGILSKLGAVLDPSKASSSPEELTAKLQEKDAELLDNKRELAVLRIAGGDEGNKLLDSRKFMNSVKGLDPTGDAFAEKVKAAMTPTTDADSGGDKDKTKTTTPGKSAGADMSGGSTGAKKQLTRADLAGMSSEQIVKAQEEGLLDNLMKNGA